MDSNAMLLGAFPQINRVAVRIPRFWPYDPEMWFAQVENQFALSRITTAETKFNYIAGNLESRHAFEVCAWSHWMGVPRLFFFCVFLHYLLLFLLFLCI